MPVRARSFVILADSCSACYRENVLIKPIRSLRIRSYNGRTPSTDRRGPRPQTHPDCVPWRMREVLYFVYETPPIEIQRGVAQDSVSGTCLKCDK